MKKIKWVGSADQELLFFPREAMRRAGRQLNKVQRGEEPDDWKPMNSVGSGVKEIRIHTLTEHRAIYVAKFEEAVYVLHCFEKKTRQTPLKSLKLAEERYKWLVNQRRADADR